DDQCQRQGHQCGPPCSGAEAAPEEYRQHQQQQRRKERRSGKMRDVGTHQGEQVQDEGADQHAGKLPDEGPCLFVGSPPPAAKEGRQQAERDQQKHDQSIGEQQRPELLTRDRERRLQASMHDPQRELDAEIVRPDRIGDARRHQARFRIGQRHHLEEVRRPDEGRDQDDEENDPGPDEEPGEACDRPQPQAGRRPEQGERESEHQEACGELRGADIGHDAERGDDAVEQQALVIVAASQPCRRIGQDVVDGEVEDHRGDRGQRLRHPEHRPRREAGIKHREMDARADQRRRRRSSPAAAAPGLPTVWRSRRTTGPTGYGSAARAVRRSAPGRSRAAPAGRPCD
ncbi:hypothetical protein OSTOST_13841, partial [Ostertagia ostertagi]